MPARTTVQLDPGLAQRLRGVVPSRGLNRFINQAVSEKLAAIERDKLEAEMREGYQAAERDQKEVAADWEPLSIEGWPR